ncbi:MAG TPA: hypothetical protein VHM19_01370, partial [Polyangiales bacterium]|nr:hypothetical protein [Polyangiales bacterium]
MRLFDVRRPGALTRLFAWALGCSLLVHLVLYFVLRPAPPRDDSMRIELPSQVELGVTDTQLGSDPAPAPAPPPAAKAEPKHTAPKPVTPQPKSQDIVLPHDAGVPPDAAVAAGDAGDRDAASEGTSNGKDGGEPAAISGNGDTPGASGPGGFGPGGTGDGMYSPAGATIALNVDLERVRSSSLLLEATALLQIIPEWELLLQGSGLDPVKDLTRVFVATPNLSRASLVVAARPRGG